jgi:outer membrane receptor for ferrienterochelin and colicin
METIKQLPGLISSDVAGMMYQGKQLEVFLDGRPLNISSAELNSFLEGMPANSVERIEVITQPGAEFPATSGGAILNIITNRNAKKYLSATYTSSSNFNSYDKIRFKTYNSVLLNAKNKYFGWQLNFGQNYRENASWSEFLNTSSNTILSKAW